MNEGGPHLAEITSVRLTGGFEVELRFRDGSERRVDLDPYLRGPMFEPLRSDPELFRRVTVDPGLGTIVWPNGADLDPDVLHSGGTPGWARKAAEESAGG